jgi:oligoribonuclease
VARKFKLKSLNIKNNYMAKSKKNLIWIDLEMTGLDTNNDYIIEIATIVTDGDLNVLAEGPMIAIHQSDETLEAMDEWNTRHRSRSRTTNT